MNNNSAALSSKQKFYLALAVVFHFALLMWTVLPLIPLCCSARVSKAALYTFVFLGWFAAFPLSFFNAIGKRISIASFLLVAFIVAIKFGFIEGTYGLMAIEPLLGLTLGLFVALAL